MAQATSTDTTARAGRALSHPRVGGRFVRRIVPGSLDRPEPGSERDLLLAVFCELAIHRGARWLKGVLAQRNVKSFRLLPDATLRALLAKHGAARLPDLPDAVLDTIA